MSADTAKTETQKYLELFDQPDQDSRDVEWFVRFLQGKDWTTAEEVLKGLGKEPSEDAKRWVRHLCDRSNGRVVGFVKGYKLTAAMSEEQYTHWRNTTLKATNSVRERVLRTDLVRGFEPK